jgi:hypothetical protein
MGLDPEISVTDDTGLVHGFDNLFVAGAGGFVTSAGVNPCLTIVALALRAAPHIINSARQGTLWTTPRVGMIGRMLATLTGLRGAKQGANADRCQATSGHHKP